MSSVSVIPSAEPRSGTFKPAPARGGDPFSAFLESASVSRHAQDETITNSGKRQEPNAPVSNAGARSESLERCEIKGCISTNRRAPDSAMLAGNSKFSDGNATEELAEPALAEEAGEVEQQTDGGADETGEVAAAATDFSMVLDGIVEEDASSTKSEVSSESDETKVSGHFDIADIPSDTTDAADVADASDEVTDPKTAPAENMAQETASLPEEKVSDPLPDDVPEAEIETAEETAVSAEATAASQAVAKDMPSTSSPVVNADAAKAAPVLPASGRNPAPGSDHVPGQQSMQGNLAASGSDDSAAPASGDGDAELAQQQPRTAPQTQPAKPENPSSLRPPEFVQAFARPADGSKPPIQIDPGASGVEMQPVRAMASNLNPAIIHAAHASEPGAVPLTGIELAMAIISRMRDGMRRFDIRLDPPELGRVDVRLDVDRHGKVTTKLTVDRPETLDLMQREARGLERALQQAGLKTDEGGLQFSLRQHADNRHADGRAEGADPYRDLVVTEEGEPAESAIESYRAAVLARGGVDIRI